MRALTSLFVALTLASTVSAANGDMVVAAHGVRVVVPGGWRQVASAGDGPVVDPKTLLVVGTAGVHPRASRCQIAAYSIPAGGAVVVIVGWKSATAGGGQLEPGREPLTSLRQVRRPSFVCFNGRGAVAQVVLGDRAYQISVMVGERAGRRVVAQALAVGRTFGLAR